MDQTISQGLPIELAIPERPRLEDLIQPIKAPPLTITKIETVPNRARNPILTNLEPNPPPLLHGPQRQNLTHARIGLVDSQDQRNAFVIIAKKEEIHSGSEVEGPV
jgi:hypothetical protein